MKEILKRLTALLCLVAMLSFVSTSAFGSENPWDSDGSSGGSNTGAGSGSSDPGPNGTDQPVYLGTVYVGADGLLTFVSQSVNYLVSYFTYLGRSVTENPDSRTEASQQKDF